MAVKRTPGGHALTELILEIFKVNGELLAAGDRLVEDLGQTSARWQVMGAIADAPISVAAIARRMGLARQSVQRTVDILVADATCVFLENPGNRRSPLVTLSENGKIIFQKISDRQAKWSNHLARFSSAREISRANTLLKSFSEFL